MSADKEYNSLTFYFDYFLDKLVRITAYHIHS